MQLHYLYKRPVASATSLGGEVVLNNEYEHYQYQRLSQATQDIQCS